MKSIHAKMASLLFAVLLGGCGGGGASSDVTTHLDAQSSYTAQSPSVGDYYTYKYAIQIKQPFTGTKTGISTALYTTVNADGSSIMTSLADDSPLSQKKLAPNGGFISDTYCTYSPAWVAIPPSLSVGLTWENATTQNCNGTLGYLTSKGTVTGIESITVPAGSFETMKITYTRSWDLTGFNVVETSTCWREVHLGRNIKCTRTTTTTVKGVTTGIPPSIDDSTEELVGFANAKSGRQIPAVERFAGTWSGTYSGADSGNCNVRVDTNGTVSGSCSSSSSSNGTLFNVNGNVDAQGTLTFNLSAGAQSGPTLKASGISLPTWTGTWNTSTGASGTWTLSHI